jgi:hypothetical protein
MRRPTDILDESEVSRVESYTGIFLMLASFIVAANVCTGIAGLAMLP